MRSSRATSWAAAQVVWAPRHRTEVLRRAVELLIVGTDELVDHPAVRMVFAPAPPTWGAAYCFADRLARCCERLMELGGNAH